LQREAALSGPGVGTAMLCDIVNYPYLVWPPSFSSTQKGTRNSRGILSCHTTGDKSHIDDYEGNKKRKTEKKKKKKSQNSKEENCIIMKRMRYHSLLGLPTTWKLSICIPEPDQTRLVVIKNPETTTHVYICMLSFPL
jgi:hypothetical protein